MSWKIVVFTLGFGSVYIWYFVLSMVLGLCIDIFVFFLLQTPSGLDSWFLSELFHLEKIRSDIDFSSQLSALDEKGEGLLSVLYFNHPYDIIIDCLLCYPCSHAKIKMLICITKHNSNIATQRFSVSSTILSLSLCLLLSIMK